MERSLLRSSPALVLLAALVLAGCSSMASPPLSGDTSPGLAPTCAVTFSPEPALEGATNSAASDWSAATGCAITVGPGGIPVELADSIQDDCGAEHQGATSAARDRIRVHRLTSRRYAVLLHEMGHALGGDHTDTDGALSGAPGRRNVIDGAALETVCARLPCAWMAPVEWAAPE